MNRFPLFVAAVLAMAGWPPAALCQPVPLQAVNWDLAVSASISTGEEHLNSLSEAQILKAGIFVGKTIINEMGTRWWRGSLEYGFCVTPIVLALRPQTLYGVGFEPVIVRFNSLAHVGPVVPYLELAGGGLKTSENLPSGDTSSFNFTVKGGGGVYLRGNDRHALELGLSWSHISNANLGRRNPEFNGVEMRLAYHWFR